MPTFTVIPNYYIACPECVGKLTIKAASAIQTNQLRQEDYLSLPCAEPAVEVSATEAPIMETAC